MHHLRRDVDMVPMMMGWGLGWVFPLFGLGMMGLVGWALFTRGMDGQQPSSLNAPSADPLDLARERYAQGLISKPEFETLVEELLRTEHQDPRHPKPSRGNPGGRPWG